MRTKAALLFICAWAPCLAQKPVIGSQILNSATMANVGSPPPGSAPYAAAGGSIATIFGKSLAAEAVTAGEVPLPTTLGGVRVFLNGTPAPLFYVSPTQINFQIPFLTDVKPGIVVQTPSGTSDPTPFSGALEALGVFTQDASGCGPAWIFNIGPDGSWSLNSPDNSVEPGGIITILGTGRGGAKGVVDGEPSPLTPPIIEVPDVFAFSVPTEGTPINSSVLYDNRAPGMIGVDQFNLKLPDNVIEGCGIPLQLIAYASFNTWDSQQVPVNVHRGGGKCSGLPPPQTHAELTLQKITTSDGKTTSTVEQLNVSASGAVGKRVPDANPAYPDVPNYSTFGWFRQPGVPHGPSCAFPAFEDKPVDMGPITISGPQVKVSGTDGSDTSYQVALPAGAIIPGDYVLSSPGGADVGAFSTTVAALPEIQFDDPVPDRAVHMMQNFTLKWTGGEGGEIVRVRFSIPGGPAQWVWQQVGNATDGEMLFWVDYKPPLGYSLWLLPTDQGQLTISLESTPFSAAFSAPGLTLGGAARWSRVWQYNNLTFTYCDPAPAACGSTGSASAPRTGLAPIEKRGGR